CSDLLREGDIDAVVRKAISRGLDPVRAIQLATINAADYFRLHDRGAIGPGYIANLMTMTDLTRLDIDTVFYKGKPVAKQGKALFLPPTVTLELKNTVRIKSPTKESLKIPAVSETHPVIEIVPGQIVTKKAVEKMKVVDGVVMSDVERDILKLVVVERHRASGNIGLGLVRGFGLKKGALASSIAHDSHNIIAVGVDDLDILKAIEEINRLQGGLAVSANLEVIASLPLPIAGLLSPEPLDTVTFQYEKVEKAAASLGNLPPAPFAILSFLALPVIPDLRLTDLGLVDVLESQLIK
ncbi:MAG: adenine deaminase C-terminal domain-containing protein, partial [Dehalococcoidia bacterium]